MNYNMNYVNKDEANALKEMIFNRVRERSQALNEDIQSDIMDVARESFVSRNNPFSQILKTEAEKINEEKVTTVVKTEEKEEIGFPQRELKPRAVELGRIANEQGEIAAIQSTMSEARAQLSNKKSFMGALNFLNSQAAASLVRNRSGNFEAVI